MMNENQNQPQEVPQLGSEEQEKLERFLFAVKARQDVPSAIAAGLLAAIVGAVLWALITIAAKYQIGFMAIGVGLLVGFAVRYFGNGISTQFGVIGAIAAFLGCFTGNLLSTAGFIAAAQDTSFFQVLSMYDLTTIIEMTTQAFNVMDILFYGLAVYEGYRFSFRQVSIEELKSISTENQTQDFEGPKVRNRILLVSSLLVVLLLTYFLIKSSQGEMTFTYPSGAKSAKGSLTAGVPEGWWIYWHENGAISCEGHFTSGLEDSLWQWWDDTGNLIKEGGFQNGMMHGQWKLYYPEGNISESGKYKYNRRHGIWNVYYENGTKQAEYDYHRDHLNGKSTFWHSNGQKSTEGMYQDDEPIGEWQYWYENGQIMDEVEYVDHKPRIRNSWLANGKSQVVNGNGRYVIYYKDGTKEIEGRLKNGFKMGEWKIWYPNEQIQKIVTYDGDQEYLKSFWKENAEQMVVDGNGYYVLYFENGNKSVEGNYLNGLAEGTWNFWYEDGSEGQVLNFRGGKQNGTMKGWFVSGGLFYEGMMIDDEQDGEWNWFHENGQLESQVTFIRGQKQGSQPFWNESGILIKEEVYEDGQLKQEKISLSDKFTGPEISYI